MYYYLLAIVGGFIVYKSIVWYIETLRFEKREYLASKNVEYGNRYRHKTTTGSVSQRMGVDSSDVATLALLGRSGGYGGGGKMYGNQVLAAEAHANGTALKEALIKSTSD